jgi:hypothetical protein
LPVALRAPSPATWNLPLRRKQRLFDLETRDRLRSQTARATAWVFFGASVIVGLLIWGLHHEEPFVPYWLSICPRDVPRYDCEYSPWLDFLAGASAFGVFGLFVWITFKLRQIRPTVRCKRCGGRGWIVDLQSTAGHCPACGHDRFAYFTLEANGVQIARIWRIRDACGQELLELNARNKQLL